MATWQQLNLDYRHHIDMAPPLIIGTFILSRSPLFLKPTEATPEATPNATGETRGQAMPTNLLGSDEVKVEATQEEVRMGEVGLWQGALESETKRLGCLRYCRKTNLQIDMMRKILFSFSAPANPFF